MDCVTLCNCDCKSDHGEAFIGTPSAQIGYSLDGCCCCLSQRQLLLLAHDSLQQHYAGRLRRKEQGTVLHGQKRQAKLSGERLLLLTPIVRLVPRHDLPKQLCCSRIFFISPMLMFCGGSSFNLNHKTCSWVQYGNDS